MLVSHKLANFKANVSSIGGVQKKTSSLVANMSQTVSYLPWADPESQSLSDLQFVAVRRSAVDVSVPTVQSSQNCLLDLKNTRLLSISSHQREPRGRSAAGTWPGALFQVPRPTVGILWPVARVTYALMVPLRASDGAKTVAGRDVSETGPKS